MARGKRIQEAVEQSKDGVLKMSLWRLDQKYVHCTPVMKHNFGPQMGEVAMGVSVADWLLEQPHTSHHRTTGKYMAGRLRRAVGRHSLTEEVH